MVGQSARDTALLQEKGVSWLNGCCPPTDTGLVIPTATDAVYTAEAACGGWGPEMPSSRLRNTPAWVPETNSCRALFRRPPSTPNQASSHP